MKLAEVVNKIGTSDVLLTEGRSLFGRLIQGRTHSRFSHAGLLVWIHAERSPPSLAIVEALDWVGVRLYPIEKYLRDCAQRGECVHWFAVTDQALNREAAASFALSWWGNRYANWQQFAASFARWSRPLWKIIGLKDADTDPFRWHCSELVASSLLFGGYRPPDGDEAKPWRITPGHVALFTCLQRRGVLEL